MAKKSALFDALAQLPDQRGGKTNWLDRLKDGSPELYDEVISLIDRHMDGDREITRKLPSETAFCRWLSTVLAARGVNVRPQTLTSLFRLRRGERGIK